MVDDKTVHLTAALIDEYNNWLNEINCTLTELSALARELLDQRSRRTDEKTLSGVKHIDTNAEKLLAAIPPYLAMVKSTVSFLELLDMLFEIRTPINVVYTFAKAYQAGRFEKLSAAEAQLMDQIVEHAERLYTSAQEAAPFFKAVQTP